MGIDIVITVPKINITFLSDNKITINDQRVKIEITGYKAIHQFFLNERVTRQINDINVIIPILEKIVADLCKQGKMQMNIEKLYYHPLHITLLKANQPEQFYTIAGSGRALANLLEDTRTGQLSPLKGTLITHDRTKNYHEALLGFSIFWGGGGLEWLRDLPLKMETAHFNALTALQLSIVPRGKNVLRVFSDLLKKGCFNNLKNLCVQFSAASQPVVHEKGWICIGLQKEDDLSEENYWEAYYLEVISIQLNRNKNEWALLHLESLHITLWAERTHEILEAVSLHFPTLKNLTIDDVMSQSKVKREFDFLSEETEIIDEYKGLYYTTTTTRVKFRKNYAQTLVPNDAPDQLTLDQVIDQHKNNNLLQELQIYIWGIKGQAPQFDYTKLAHYLQNGWLPHLNSIVMQSHQDYRQDDCKPINPDTAMDITSLFDEVINALKGGKMQDLLKLSLLMPEKHGYMIWLNALREGVFSELREFAYLIPASLKGESHAAHKVRIEIALITIRTAIEDGKLPKLHNVMISGSVPAELMLLVLEIENMPLVLKNQALLEAATKQARPSTEIKILEEDEFEALLTSTPPEVFPLTQEIENASSAPNNPLPLPIVALSQPQAEEHILKNEESDQLLAFITE